MKTLLTKLLGFSVFGFSVLSFVFMGPVAAQEVQTAIIDDSVPGSYLNLSQRGGRPIGPGVDNDGPPPLQQASMQATFSNFELNGIAFDAWQSCRATGTVDDCLAVLGPSLRQQHPGGIGGDTFAFDVTITNTSPAGGPVLTSFAFQSKFSESPALGSRIGDKLFFAARAGLTSTAAKPLIGVKKNGTSNGLFRDGKVKGICINSSDDYPSDLNLGVENETLECAGGRTFDRSTNRPVLQAANGQFITEDSIIQLPKGLLPGESMTMRLLLDAGTDDGALQRAHGAAGPHPFIGPLTGALLNTGQFRAPGSADECLVLDPQFSGTVQEVVNFGDVKIIRDSGGNCAPSFLPFDANQFLTIPRRNWGFTDILDTRDDYLSGELPTVLTNATGKFSFLDFEQLRPGEMNFFEILRGFGEFGATLDPSCQSGGSRAGTCGGAPYIPWAEFYAIGDGKLVRQEVVGGYGGSNYAGAPTLTASIDTGGQTSCTGPGLAVKCKTTDPFEPAGSPNPGSAIGASATATFSDVVVISDDKNTIPNEGGQAGGDKVQVTVTITNTSPAESNIYLTSFNFQTKRRGLTDINELDGTTIQGRQDLRVGPENPAIGFPFCGADPLQAACFDEGREIGRFPNVLGNSLLSSVAVSGLEAGRLEAIKKNGTFQPLMRSDDGADNFICIKSGPPSPDQDADETCSGQAGSGLLPGDSQSVRLELDYGDFRGLILRVAPGTLFEQDPPFGLLALGGDFDCRDQRRLPYCHPDLVNQDWFTEPESLEEVEFVTVHQPGDAATVMNFRENFGILLAMAGFVPTAEFYQGSTQLQVKGRYENLPGSGTAPPDNEQPVANFTSSCQPQNADGTVTCTLDGSASFDPDGSIESWNWAIVGPEEDTSHSASESGPVVDHVFPEPGLYTVTLTVSDNEGATGSLSQSVSAPAGDTDRPPGDPPTAEITYACEPFNSGFRCNFDGSGTTAGTDPISSYQWQFFREEMPTGSGDPELLETLPGITVSYVFTDVNTVAYKYFATLTVTDAEGRTDTASEDIVFPASEPEPEPIVVLTVTTTKVQGINIASLTWQGGSSPFDVRRNGSTVASSVTGNSYTDNTGTRGRRTFTYQVCAAGSTDNCSNEATVTF